MIVLAWIVLSFTAIQLLVALVNLIFSQPFHQQESSYNPLVSVLIPARNEENNIAVILTDLQQLQYKNLEIIVFNDQSEDKTPEIVQEFAKKDLRIKLINSTGLPAGWLGKNHACYSLAKIATGDYFLFIDADVRVFSKIISETVAFSEKHTGITFHFSKANYEKPGRVGYSSQHEFHLVNPAAIDFGSKNQLSVAGSGKWTVYAF